MTKVGSTEKRKDEIIIEAFKELISSDELNAARGKIENEIKGFMKFLETKLNEEQRIFQNIEVRIKEMDKFIEKIHRKNYVANWDIGEKSDSQKNKECICKNLTDLIGFRINCFFMKDETAIYDLLKSYSDADKFNDITLNFQEGIIQNNGHNISKVSGTYDNAYSFEIQIKSIMHNLWGEVEHKTIYKNKIYDAGIIPRKAIIEEVFNILSASDKQLVELFSQDLTKKQLLYALFFKKSIGKICEEVTTVMANHYDLFFKVFSNQEKLIKKYIAFDLLEEKFEKQKPENVEKTELVKLLGRAIKNELNTGDVKCILVIAKQLWELKSEKLFLDYFASQIITKFKACHVEDNDSEFIDGDEAIETLEDEVKNIMIFLKKILGGAN